MALSSTATYGSPKCRKEGGDGMHARASYGLYADGVRGSFAEGRIGYREWACKNGRLADIHSIDDRYDHDIDELIA
jgi:hypothetical protein